MKKRFVFLSLLTVIVLLIAVTATAFAATTTASTTVEAGTVVREGHLTYSGMSDEEYFKFMSEAADNGNNNGNNNNCSEDYVWNDYRIDRPEEGSFKHHTKYTE